MPDHCLCGASLRAIIYKTFKGSVIVQFLAAPVLTNGIALGENRNDAIHKSKKKHNREEIWLLSMAVEPQINRQLPYRDE
jgi:hypothetical protein